jgi:hypothetical protein
MLAVSNPVGKNISEVIVGLNHVLVNHKLVAPFLKAVIKSY